ncbi:hypothetical protein F5Y06DRAFT_302742 [Hypoxylon sp. FL0890]|nr:hypothetical protein F5Y06DRAFT_302742 [Hypoxylon sp. FL0890]
MANLPTTVAIPSNREPGAPETLSLPPEFIARMIEVVPDYMMPYVWWKLRSVCKSWKAEVEKAFREKYLPTTTITFHINVETETVARPFVYEFSRVSKRSDAARAFFRPYRGESRGFQPHETLRGPFPVHRPFDNLFHQVEMANIAVSDPALEGFIADHRQQEISVLWTPMISQLMAEEIRIRRRAAEMVAARFPGETAQEGTVGPKVHSRQAANLKFQFWMLQKDESFVDVICDVRESRIRKQYEKCGVEFQSMGEHDGGPMMPRKKSLTSWSTRFRFRSPAQYMEV